MGPGVADQLHSDASKILASFPVERLNVRKGGRTMKRYYKVDGQKLSYQEYWRMSPEPLSFLIAALRKLLRIPVEFKFSIPRVESLPLLDPAEIPGRVKKKWSAIIDACEDQGLQVQFY